MIYFSFNSFLCTIVVIVYTVHYAGATLITNKYNAVHGQGIISTKTNMAVINTRSRIECSIKCEHLYGCGGFNYLTDANAVNNCYLKQARTTSVQIQIQTDATYFENIDQDPSTVSRDCKNLQDEGITVSGVYSINMDPDGPAPELVQVYCDMDTDGGGWTVFMRREDGSVDFDRNWSEYKYGFGNIQGEFWLGLETMNRITTNGNSYQVRVDMTTFTGVSRYATYSTFVINSEAEFYRLLISGYSGNALDSFTYHNNLAFSTSDVDNDEVAYSCAAMYHSGFWYKDCSTVRLTGLYGETLPDTVISSFVYHQGILWFDWLGYDIHPEFIDMKIKP